MDDVGLAHALQLLIVLVLCKDVRTLTLPDQAKELKAVCLCLGSICKNVVRVEAGLGCKEYLGN